MYENIDSGSVMKVVSYKPLKKQLDLIPYYFKTKLGWLAKMYNLKYKNFHLKNDLTNGTINCLFD